MTHVAYKRVLEKWRLELKIKSLSGKMDVNKKNLSAHGKDCIYSFSIVYDNKEFRFDLPAGEIFNRLVASRLKKQLISYDKERGAIPSKKKETKTRRFECPKCGGVLVEADGSYNCECGLKLNISK